jgi:hypothetical protein
LDRQQAFPLSICLPVAPNRLPSITVLSCEAKKAAGKLGIIDETRAFTEEFSAWKTTCVLVD